MDSETSGFNLRSGLQKMCLTPLSHSRHGVERITPTQFNNVFIWVRALSTFKFFYDKVGFKLLITFNYDTRSLRFTRSHSDPSARLVGSDINDQHCVIGYGEITCV